MNIVQLKNFLLESPGYLKKSAYYLASRFSIDIELAEKALKLAKEQFKHDLDNPEVVVSKEVKDSLNSFKSTNFGDIKVDYMPMPEISKKAHNGNVFVIGDLHSPFIKEGYLEHCIKTYNDFNCSQVVMIGDAIDNHFSSYHEVCPDGLSAGDELDLAIEKLKPWFKAFPNAKVCIGNHDAIIARKALSSGLSKRWVKDYNEVLGCPGWEFSMEHEIDGVIYYHGTGSSGDKAALNRAMNLRQSVVQGHLHTAACINYSASRKDLIWGMQVGCGVEDTAYAMAYASSFTKKSILSCGVVLNYGKLPIVVPMECK